MSAEKVECRQEETLIVYRVKSRALFINNPLFILCVSTLPDAITRVAIHLVRLDPRNFSQVRSRLQPKSCCLCQGCFY